MALYYSPQGFGSVLQNYEAIDRFSDSIITETNAAHNGQVLYFGTRSRCCTKVLKLPRKLCWKDSKQEIVLRL